MLIELMGLFFYKSAFLTLLTSIYFKKSEKMCVCVCFFFFFPFWACVGIWDLIVLVPDHCFFLLCFHTEVYILNSKKKKKRENFLLSN